MNNNRSCSRRSGRERCLQAPLTLDHGAVIDCIRELDTTIIPRGGTNIAEAIRYTDRPFGQNEKENRALILFTDGEEL